MDSPVQTELSFFIQYMDPGMHHAGAEKQPGWNDSIPGLLACTQYACFLYINNLRNSGGRSLNTRIISFWNPL